ncbi:MAG: Asp-tRNA(Asn)/Glu-tRNA(Gln) amidotransferase subunit GatB [Planctomycetaceae bacterium]|jgi:aspartyl-tRNA(Asn)/glutamyl-tRNA(Gln) amidotransferase subunit B|nr:Asp-tRNA(Asn)/Glu-tRNA(Gln) amidotransferase subunit GatB [Planctomycetaceae bacterium]MCP4813942.1 Asp-tRNA(Asn)/Glu-tRNA(Gln) amidotransferase subunit GatB [Planctomycetaceae bacterium]
MNEPLYQVIIGLEVHVQLKTESKLFCRCSTDFGQPPNTQTCPVCIGMPGSLPVMNEKAFQLAVKTAIALDCEIPEFTKWDRKNYYYPDLPKGYQISQFDLPMSCRGSLHIEDPEGAFEPKDVRITRAHLEEDAGKSMHDEVAGKADSSIDLNRTGTPLLEIVSEPDLRSAEEARAYLSELKLLLTYLDVSDCNMQEGSLRVDANINLHLESPDGTVATPIVEVKNMNSFRAVERALIYEAGRQWDVWQETGQKLGDVPKQTRGWDDQAQITRGQRHKEESSDYRYFPEPDLVPVRVSAEEVAAIRTNIGELPAAIRERLVADHGISSYTSEVLVNQGRGVVDYFVQVAESCGDGKLAGNWVQQEVLRTLKEQETQIEAFPVASSELADLLGLVQRGELDSSRGKEVFVEMVQSGKSATQVMQEKGMESVDEDEVIQLCQTLLEENPQVVVDVQGGKQQAVGALVGKAKQQNSNINPGSVRQILLELIQKMG